MSQGQPQDFIPFGQSTPRSFDRAGGGWRGNRNHHNRSNQRWGNNSRNQNSNSSGFHNRQSYNSNDDISAYLHPSMLQDPWRHLSRAPLTPQQPPPPADQQR